MTITTDRGIQRARVCAYAGDVRAQAAGRDHLSGRGREKQKPLRRARVGVGGKEGGEEITVSGARGQEGWAETLVFLTESEGQGWLLVPTFLCRPLCA